MYRGLKWMNVSFTHSAIIFLLWSTYVIISPTLLSASSNSGNGNNNNLNMIDEEIVLDALQCTRIFYSDGSVGCRENNRNGVDVILLKVSSLNDPILAVLSQSENEEDDDDNTVKKKTSSTYEKEKIGLVLPSNMLTNTTLNALLALSSNIKAIVVENLEVPPAVEECVSSDGYYQCGEEDITVASSYSPDVGSPQGIDTPNSVLPFISSNSSSSSSSLSKMKGNYRWNLFGNSLLLQDFALPVVVIDEKKLDSTSSFEITSLNDIDWSTQESNYLAGKSPVIRASLNYYFGPENMNSVSCLKWKNTMKESSPQCLPLGGQSIWGSSLTRAELMNKTSPSSTPSTSTARENQILLSTGIDTNALFHDVAYGANDAVASIITLLATARALATYNFTETPIPVSSWNTSLLFGLFQGEQYGFLGSNRFFTDITSFICNEPSLINPENSPDGSGACTSPVRASLAFESLNLTSIKLAIAIDQVGLLNKFSSSSSSSSSLYLLTSDYEALVKEGILDAFNNSVSDSEEVSLIMPTEDSVAIPPSPLNPLSYLAETKENSTIPMVFLTGYNETGFIDPAYHSHWDVKSHINTTSIFQASEVLLKALVSIVAETEKNRQEIPSIKPDMNLIERLVDCLTSNLYCDFVQKYVTDEYSNLINYIGHDIYIPTPPSPPSYYTGVVAYYRGQTVIENNYDYCGDCPERGGSFSYSDGDRIYAVPSYIEAFLHSYLSETLAMLQQQSTQQEDEDGDKQKKFSSCSYPSDCIGLEEGAGGETGYLYQCINAKCIATSSAYYHPAIDVSILPTSDVAIFDLLDSNGNIITSGNYNSNLEYTFQTPIWTEPNWATINTIIYSSVSMKLEFIIFGVGLGITMVSMYGTYMFKRMLEKNKLI